MKRLKLILTLFQKVPQVERDLISIKEGMRMHMRNVETSLIRLNEQLTLHISHNQQKKES